MPEQEFGGVNVPLYAFNRGLLDPLALARADLQRTALSAEIQTNFMPRSLGAMSLRPGLGYKGNTYSDAFAVFAPFIFSTSDTALVELTPDSLRMWVGDEVLSRDAVSTVLLNGEFSLDVADWTDADDTGATSAWATGGYLSLIGTDFAAAKRYQAVTIASADQGVQHALSLEVEQGEVTLRVGTSVGDDDLREAAGLGKGSHSITFTPASGTGTVYVQLEASTRYASLVSFIQVAGSGAMVLSTPWGSETALRNIRWVQSGDVIYMACGSACQRRLERRSNGSWSLVLYAPKDGPFRDDNTGPVSITASAIAGTVTLTASGSLFHSTHVDSLIRLTSTGQQAAATFTADGQDSDYVQVTGVGTQRILTVIVSGTFTGTITLQRSVGDPGSWINIKNYTTGGTDSYDDDLDNQIIYYRLLVTAWTSGTANITLSYPSGSLNGVVRVTAVASATSATAIVLLPLGGTTATRIWAEGAWSSVYGHPNVPALFDGRLWWFGKGTAYGSISDAFESFDSDLEGDAAPINKTLVDGPVDRIQWAMPLQRLILGADGAELAVRASNDNEVLKPENVTVRASSTQGSANVAAVRVDTGALFVQRSGRRVFETRYQLEPNDYAASDLTQHATHVGRSGIVRAAVQRQPDTRIHLVRTDGKVAVCLLNKAEEILCWVLVETDGVVEDVVVLPGTDEDAVYYSVKRTVNGSTVRFLERWAQEDDCRPWTTTYSGDPTITIPVDYEDDTLVTVRDVDGDIVENVTASSGQLTLTDSVTYAHVTQSVVPLADAYVLYSGEPTTTITGLSHLEGESVVVWADGRDQGTFTVSSGQITGLAEQVEEAVVGLPYTGKFQSTKLAYADTEGTSLLQRKRITELGVLLYATHHLGLQFGRDFDHLYDMDQQDGSTTVVTGTVYLTRDVPMVGYEDTYDTDSRVCLQATAPRPCTVLGAVISMETLDA